MLSDLAGKLAGEGWTRVAVLGFAWTGFLFLWLLVAKSDWRARKITHRHLGAGLVLAFMSYAALVGGTILGGLRGSGVYYEWGFYRELAGHVLASAVAAVGMWRFGIWPAGDAKLFAFLAILYPLMALSAAFRASWLFLVVLINIFIPAWAAVFLQAARYVWASRFRHSWEFLRQMGWKKELDYARDGLRDGAAGAWGRAKEDLAWARQHPASVGKAALMWGASLMVMSFVSFLVQGVISSPIVRAVACFAVLLVWGRINDLVRRLGAWSLIAPLALGILAWRWPSLRHEMARSMGYMTLFGLSLSMGMKWTVGAAKGQVMMLAMPLVGMLFGLVPWVLSWRIASLYWLRPLVPLALLGLFFGLSFVLVRIWDNEDHPDIPPDKLLSYMVLHHSFVEKLQEDEDFYDEHFAYSYADGLTAEQAEALKSWCAENGITTVALTGTVPFAHWIFLGYLLTWLLSGHILQRLY